MAEAKVSVSRTIVWLTLLSLVVASPTRRHFAETTTARNPADTGTAWEDDSDHFDLDEDDWLNHARAASPSSLSERRDYDEYDDDDDEYATLHNGKVVVDLGDDEDVEHQDAEDDDGDHQPQNDSEFLFLPPRDTRLVLEDDDDSSGPIKVRHTGKSAYPRIVDADNSVEESSEEDEKDNDDSRPFEFTIDEDDKGRDDDDEFVVEDLHEKGDDDDSVEVLPKHKVHEDEEDFDDDSDDDEEHMFENPEDEAAQVIYGDHVFLY